MPRHNWDKTIENLKSHPGEEILVAEHVSNGYGDKRMREAGMEIRKERVTAKLYNLYARYTEPTSYLNFAAIEAAAIKREYETLAEAARKEAVIAEAELREAQQILRQKEDTHLAKQATLRKLLERYHNS